MAHATTTSRTALARALTTQIDTLVGELTRARRGDARGIHRARTTSRRLRELLPVAAAAVPVPGADRLRREIRRVTRLLGRVRELDVSIALFAEISVQVSWDAVVVADLGRRLIDERDRSAHAASSSLRAIDPARLRARLDAVVQSVEANAVPGVAERALAARLRRRAASLFRAIEQAGTLYVPERLHDVRISAKKLRYALEVAHTAAGLPVRPFLASLKRHQDLLGRLHDLEVLAGRARALTARQGSRDAAGGEVIVADLETACRALHASFVSRRSTIQRMATRTIETIVRDLAAGKPRMARIGPAGLRPRPARPAVGRELARTARGMRAR